MDALSDLKDRIRDAIRDGHPPESPDLAMDVIQIADMALWCRDAGLAWTRTGFSWGELALATGVPETTLQSRWSTWYRRGGMRA